MLKAQRDSIRLLRVVFAASLVLPVALFAYASWLTYRSNEATNDREIAQTRDVLTEHALKVFESVEHSIAEINEMIRDLSDDELLQRGELLHQRLKRIAASSEQVKSLWILDRNGRALVDTLSYPSSSVSLADRDYFAIHRNRDVGTFIGPILQPRAPYGGAAFFSVSRRRIAPGNEFAGVVQASLLPEYFEGFYAKISGDRGSYAALIHQDGAILARYPALDGNGQLRPSADLSQLMRAGSLEGILTVRSSIDHRERKLAYRKLPDLPVYVVAGLETEAIRAKWLAVIGNQLIFGIPATTALLALVALALKRTRRMYEEARLRQSAEDALKQSQRLESLGRLTGGVAHDFNNLLMVVGGAARKLRRTASSPQEQRAIDMIEQSVSKGSSLTRQLLSFSRRNAMDAVPIDLGDRVQRFSDVLRQSVPSNITIIIQQPPAPVVARLDPNEFEIALLNLTLNARDAMPDGGRITISIGRRRPLTESDDILGDELAVLQFGDTGTGISPEIRDKVFEPFFTTKPVDRGTGLGLSQIYGFVQQSKGQITLRSELGMGTHFELTFPICYDPPARDDPAAAPPVPAQRAPVATLLLVEDHPDVAAVATDYAEQCGYAVVLANSAEAALQLLESRGDIKLVFSDIVMPGLSGLELGRIVRSRYPQLPVVLTSGYSDRSTTALEEGFVLLPKPYSLETLRERLAQALRGNEPPGSAASGSARSA
ncbi:MAG: hybrid sensor histidine kinase/response regulator [Rhodopseudomonas palustris]|nr:MAG: hybrid sensor histidine kinase/response regulator [Rhodopseudomonas palustris]